jgi:hypothetical protein
VRGQIAAVLGRGARTDNRSYQKRGACKFRDGLAYAKGIGTWEDILAPFLTGDNRLHSRLRILRSSPEPYNFGGIASARGLWNASLIGLLAMPGTDTNSDWKSLYEAAMRETDSSKVAQGIALARDAILTRIEKSIRNPAVADHQAMDNALRNLKKLARRLDCARSKASA